MQEELLESESVELERTGISDESNPGRTPDDELEERIELTLRLLSQGMRKSSIKNALKAQYGVSARTCENYLARARERMLIELSQDRDIHRANSLALYQSIVADPGASAKDRMAAQTRIDSLLGLETPLRLAIAMGTVHGKNAGDTVASDRGSRLSAIAERIRAAVVDGSGTAGRPGTTEARGLPGVVPAS